MQIFVTPANKLVISTLLYSNATLMAKNSTQVLCMTKSGPKPKVNRHFCLALGMCFLPGIADAVGLLRGKVVFSDSPDTGIEGVVIRINELNQQVRSRRNGHFSFNNLPEGTYTVNVSYGGMNSITKTVQIQNGKNTLDHILLKTDVENIETTRVIGDTASYNRALNKERAADSIMSIISADAIGQYPDANTSDALRRLPGLSVENDQGEGRFVRVRGMGPSYNAVNINGVRVPSPESRTRAVPLDVIPADLLESLEVSKSLTPDMDADSLGGSINLNSLSAFDRNDLFWKVTAEANFDDHSENTSPKLSLSGSNLYKINNKNENFGIAGSVSWFKREFGSDNVETGGAWDGNSLKGFEVRDYIITRERFGFGLNFDYKPNDATNLFVRTLYSEYTDNQKRNRIEYAFIQGKYNEVENAWEGQDGLAPQQHLGNTPETALEITRDLKDREENQKISSISLGGDTRLNQWKFDYNIALSKASENTPYHLSDAQFESTLSTENAGSSEINDIFFTAGDIIHIYGLENTSAKDMSNFELDKIELEKQSTNDRENSVKFDVTKKFPVADNEASIKLGFKYSDREKDNNQTLWEFGDSTQTLDKFSGKPIAHKYADMGREISSSAIWLLESELTQSINTDPNDSIDQYILQEDSNIDDYSVEEDILAGYVMGTLDANKLRLLAGIRYEETAFKANGKSYDELDGSQPVSERIFSKNNNEFLPSVHLRYLLNKKTQMRVAWSNSLVRPVFDQIRPGLSRNEDNKAEFGNPELKPLQSSNIDLGIEHYIGYASAFSAFIFYKDIENFTYQVDMGGENGTYPQYEKAITYKNGDFAQLIGVELSISKSFSELPKPWNGFMVTSNITYTDTEADISNSNIYSRKISLPHQSDLVANLALGYETSKFSIRLASNYKSKYLSEVNDIENPAEDIYVDSHLSVDLLARYYLTENFQVFFQGVNLNDESYYAYQGEKKLNAQYEEYGTNYRLGISISSF